MCRPFPCVYVREASSRAPGRQTRGGLSVAEGLVALVVGAAIGLCVVLAMGIQQ